jgi:hypothetical protein
LLKSLAQSTILQGQPTLKPDIPQINQGFFNI